MAESFQNLLESQRDKKVKEQVAISQAATTFALQKQKQFTQVYKNDIANKRIGNDAFNMVRDFISSMDGLADASGYGAFKSTMKEWQVLLTEMDKSKTTGAGAFTNPEKEYVGKIVSETLAEVYPMANMFTRVKFGFKDFTKQFKPLKLADRLLGDMPLLGGMIKRKIETQEAGEERLRGAEKQKARAAGVAERKSIQREIDVATGQDDFGEGALEEEEKERAPGVGTALRSPGRKRGAAGEEQREELFEKEEEQHTEIVSKLDAIVDNTGGGAGSWLSKDSKEKSGIFQSIKDNLGSIASTVGIIKGPKWAKSLFKIGKNFIGLGSKTLLKSAVPAASKIAVKSTTAAATSAAAKGTTKVVAKEVTEQVVKKEATEAAAKGTTKVVAKTAGKTLLKSAIKKIPVIGFIAGLGFGLHKLAKGDFTGAAMEVSSGAMSIVPGIGTAGSVAMDVAIAARDVKKAKELAENGEVADGAVEAVENTEAVALENATEASYIQKKVKKIKKNKRGQILKSDPSLPDIIAAEQVNIESKRTNVRAHLEIGELENMMLKMLPNNKQGNTITTIPVNNSSVSTTNAWPAMSNINIDGTINHMKKTY